MEGCGARAPTKDAKLSKLTIGLMPDTDSIPFIIATEQVKAAQAAVQAQQEAAAEREALDAKLAQAEAAEKEAAKSAEAAKGEAAQAAGALQEKRAALPEEYRKP